MQINRPLKLITKLLRRGSKNKLQSKIEIATVETYMGNTNRKKILKLT